jgi:hypothetical protein
VALRLLDHQVYVEGQAGCPAASLDDHGPHSDVRHEGAVHNVDVDPVRAGRFAQGNLLAEASKVR